MSDVGSIFEHVSELVEVGAALLARAACEQRVVDAYDDTFLEGQHPQPPPC